MSLSSLHLLARPSWHRTLVVCRPRQVGREFRMSRQLPEVQYIFRTVATYIFPRLFQAR
jgi:hypothetical protein